MKRINIDNIYNELWDLLGMFESKSYVCEKLYTNFGNLDVSELNTRIEIITSTVRQAREYFKASNNVSNLTSPLLVNYGMINLAKALYYLTQSTIENKHFSKHGVKLTEGTYNSIADINLEIKNVGSIIGLTTCYNEKKLKSLISLKDLLSQIPELYQLYEETFNTYSKVLYAQPTKYGYKVFSSKKDKDNIMSYIGKEHENIFTKGVFIQKSFKSSDHFFSITKAIGGDLTDNLLKTATSNTFINIQTKDNRYNQITITYLVIFTYSMLIRYQPNNWEKLINNDFSKECQIIFKSISVCREKYIIEVTKLLLGEDIEIITKDSDRLTEKLNYKEIYRNIKKEAKADAFANNRRFYY